MKRLCVTALVVLLIFSLFSVYSWQKAGRELEIQKAVHDESWSRVYLTVSEDLFELSYMGNISEGLLEQNASEDTIVEYAGSYYLRVRHIGRVFMFLSYCADDSYSKYYKLGRAFENLEGFFIDVRSKSEVDKRDTIQENLELLKKISNLSMDLYRCGDPRKIPPEIADELLNATEQLELIYR